MAYLEFKTLEPQPIGSLIAGDEACGEAFRGYMDKTTRHPYDLPDGWSESETTTQSLFGQCCFVRMADRLV